MMIVGIMAFQFMGTGIMWNPFRVHDEEQELKFSLIDGVLVRDNRETVRR